MESVILVSAVCMFPIYVSVCVVCFMFDCNSEFSACIVFQVVRLFKLL